MPTKHIFKQLSEHHCPTEVSHFCWNTKFDLLAIATVRGSIILQRVFWKKAWEYPCLDEKAKISAMCWSPRGDCLCVCFTNGQAHFLELENCRLVHKLTLEDGTDVTNLKWFQSQKIDDRLDEAILRDLAPNLMPLEKQTTGNSVQKPQKNLPTFSTVFLSDEHKICSLLCFATAYKILVFLDGYLHLFSICLPQCDAILLDFEICPNFQTFWAVFQSRNDACKSIDCLTVDLSNFSEKLPEFSEFSRRVGKVIFCMDNINCVIRSVRDSWDDILSEVGQKFTKFAKEKFFINAETTVADDLITALAFGSVSSELQLFLTTDLNEKSLKKLTQTMASTYANLQRLIARNLSSSLSTLHYHLTEVRRFSDKNLFSSEQLKNASNSCQSTVLKSREIFNVLCLNLRDFELFFTFLRQLSTRLNDEENVPPRQGISSSASSSKTGADPLSLHDARCMLNFVQETFSTKYSNSTDSKYLFKFEKVGQYLENKNLTHKFNHTLFLENSSDWNLTTSLTQEIDNLNKSVDALMRKIPENFSKGLHHSIQSIEIIKLPTDQATARSIIKKSIDQSVIVYYWTDKSASIRIFKFLEHKKKYKQIGCLNCAEKFTVKALRAYDQKNICILVESNQNDVTGCSKMAIVNEVLFQVGQDVVVKLENQEFVTTQKILGGPYENFDVCSSRKFGCILTDCRTKLKLLEMQPDEDTSLNDSLYTE